jgi:phospholipase/carboxylesterase
MAHGRQDPVVPMSLGALSRDILRKLGSPVQWRDYAMAHSVCGEEVRDLGDWLQERFAAP